MSEHRLSGGKRATKAGKVLNWVTFDKREHAHLNKVASKKGLNMAQYIRNAIRKEMRRGG